VVTSINGRSLKTAQDASDAIANLSPNMAVQFSVERGGKVTTLNTRIGQ